MIFEGFGTTFVYVVVRRVVFDFDVSFIFGVLNVRRCFLGGSLDFVFDARMYVFTFRCSPSIICICILLIYDSYPSTPCARQDSL